MDSTDYKYLKPNLWVMITFLLLHPLVFLFFDLPFDHSFWIGLVFLLIVSVPVFIEAAEHYKSKKNH